MPEYKQELTLGETSVNQPTAAQGNSSAPIKVLVIDDSNTIRRSAEMFLRQAGY